MPQLTDWESVYVIVGERSLFVVAGAVLSLVLIGIHNAWDTVTSLAIGQQEQQDRPNA